MQNKLWERFVKIIKLVVSYLYRLVGKELTENQWRVTMQFVKFCLVGITNTIISLLIYYIFIAINKKLYIAGNAVGFVISVLNSYFWNSRFVFKKQDEKGKTIVKTFLAYATNLLTGSVLLYLFVDVWKLSEIVAPLINLAFTIPLNFVLNKFWVMKS